MLQNIFSNYESNKLAIASPDLSNTLILLFLLLISILTIKKAPSQFLDRIQTEQLKGFGILFVIVGHLWVHVSQIRGNIIFGEDAIALFFLLSGFGLTVSNNNRKGNITNYIFKRIRKVLVPYWIATLILLFLDYALLKRSHRASDLLSTSLGINVNSSTIYIDYVRWYITLLLLWYILFFIAKSNTEKTKSIIFLFICAAIIFPFDYFIAHLSWYEIFSFPVGCMIGQYYDRLSKLFGNNILLFAFLSICAITFIVIYKLFLSAAIIPSMPWIAYKFLNEIISILFALGLIYLIAFMGAKNVYSEFLVFTGKISYELFLLHGAILIKYNPIISSHSVLNLSAQFVIFLIMIMFLAFLFQKGLNVVR